MSGEQMCLHYVSRMPTKSDVETMDLNDLAVYRRSMKLAERIWAEVEDWPSFARYSIGKQLTQAADSISANISEGHGRYHFGENRQFCYYARGSIQETITWIQKAKSRNLITDEKYGELYSELVEIRRMLNGYIRSIGKNNNS